MRPIHDDHQRQYVINDEARYWWKAADAQALLFSE
jgi:hypothetical protein